MGTGPIDIVEAPACTVSPSLNERGDATDSVVGVGACTGSVSLSACETPTPSIALPVAARPDLGVGTGTSSMDNAEAGITGSERGSWDDWDDEEQPSVSYAAVHVWQPTVHAGARVGTGTAIGGATVEPDLALKCSSCGHPVTRFAGAQWDESVDYYWCRNFAPDARMPGRFAEDLANLCAKLVPHGASAAYACACSWQTVTQQKLLSELGTPAEPEGGARLEKGELVKWVALR